MDDIVLLKDELTPRNQWKLAKIIEVYPGKDERVRKLKLLIGDSTLDGMGRRTSKPVHLERPIHNIRQSHCWKQTEDLRVLSSLCSLVA